MISNNAKRVFGPTHTSSKKKKNSIKGTFMLSTEPNLDIAQIEKKLNTKILNQKIESSVKRLSQPYNIKNIIIPIRNFSASSNILY